MPPVQNPNQNSKTKALLNKKPSLILAPKKKPTIQLTPKATSQLKQQPAPNMFNIT